MVDRRSTLSLHSSRHVKLGYADIDVSTIPANYPLVPRRRISTRSIYSLLSFEIIIIIISRSISLSANLIVRTINLALSLSRIVEKKKDPSIHPFIRYPFPRFLRILESRNFRLSCQYTESGGFSLPLPSSLLSSPYPTRREFPVSRYKSNFSHVKSKRSG